MRTEDNLRLHDLIGLRVRVVQARDGGMIGMEGTVVDETRETLVVEEGRRRTPLAPSFPITNYLLRKSS